MRTRPCTARAARSRGWGRSGESSRAAANIGAGGAYRGSLTDQNLQFRPGIGLGQFARVILCPRPPVLAKVVAKVLVAWGPGVWAGYSGCWGLGVCGGLGRIGMYEEQGSCSECISAGVMGVSNSGVLTVGVVPLVPQGWYP